MRAVLSVLIIFLLALTLLPLQSPKPPQPPDLVWISIDMWSENHANLSQSDTPMPFTSSLKKKGISLENFYTNALYTEPALYQQTTGREIYDRSWELRLKSEKTYPSIATQLKQKGYYTKIITNAAALLENQTKRIAANKNKPPDKNSVYLLKDFDAATYFHGNFPKISFQNSQPTYTHFVFWNLHYPLAKKCKFNQCDDGYGASFGIFTFNNTFYDRDRKNLSRLIQIIPVRPAIETLLIDDYTARLRTLDTRIKSIYVSALAHKPNTLFIVCGLHGTELGEHGKYLVSSLYNNWLKISCILLPPTLQKKSVNTFIRSIDLPSIILSLLTSNSLPENITNRKTPDPFLYLLRAESRELDVLLNFSGELRNPPENLKRKIRRAIDPPRSPEQEKTHIDTNDYLIMNNTWKLIHRPSAQLGNTTWWTFVTGKNVSYPEYELYYLPSDPAEKTNVYENFPGMTALLLQKLNAHFPNPSNPLEELTKPDRIPYP